MIKHILFKALPLLAAVAVAACSSDGNNKTATDSTPRSAEKKEIVVSVAASLRESMEEIGKAYEKETGARVLFNFGGTNDLARQIVAVPKVDIFFSAAKNWMDTVEKAGRLVPGTRSDILSNSLVVVANKEAVMSLDDPCALATLDFKNLALGDPEAVPAGKYAKQWLSTVQCNGKPLWDAVKDRVAPAPDVRAAIQLVIADPKMIGIVYKTDQLAFGDKAKVLQEVKDGPPIRYVVAQIAGGPNKEDGAKFLQYLSSPAAKTVFERHGFTTVASSL